MMELSRQLWSCKYDLDMSLTLQNHPDISPIDRRKLQRIVALLTSSDSVGPFPSSPNRVRHRMSNIECRTFPLVFNHKTN
jgi:hypothetical protein